MMPAVSRFSPSSAPLASMPSLSMPPIEAFRISRPLRTVPGGTHAVTSSGLQLGAPQTTTLAAMRAGVDHRFHVPAAFDRFNRFDPRGANVFEVRGIRVNAFAFRRFDRNQSHQVRGCRIEPFDELMEPVVGKVHLVKILRTAG